jgi:amiloride-sensitive sodium channel
MYVGINREKYLLSRAIYFGVPPIPIPIFVTLVLGNLLHQQMISKILSSQHKTDKNPLVDCDCLPSCTSIVYNAEISQSGYQNKEAKFKHVTILDIYFKEKTFTSAERNELFSPDFWANCGGLLGLFTGFSVLSIVELAYFLTLRLICNCKRYGKHFWAGVEVHTGETNNKF